VAVLVDVVAVNSSEVLELVDVFQPLHLRFGGGHGLLEIRDRGLELRVGGARRARTRAAEQAERGDRGDQRERASSCALTHGDLLSVR